MNFHRENVDAALPCVGLQVNNTCNGEILSIAIIATSILSCNNSTIEQTHTKYFRRVNYYIKESYDNNGNVISKQFYNKDTSPYGAKIKYSSLGKIIKWSWFYHSHKFPDCIVYYKPNGLFDTLAGIPFIKTGYEKDHHLAVELINPPNVKIVVGYQDFFKGRLVKKLAYPAITTDSI